MTVAVYFENKTTGERWDFGDNSFWDSDEEARRDLAEQGFEETRAVIYQVVDR